MEYVFCNQCGHKNTAGSRFCSACGAALSGQHEITNTATAIEHPIVPVSENEARCPVCEEADKTQKVSAIVASQTSSSRVSAYNFGTESSYYGSSSSRSALAEQLKKPSVPFHATVASDVIGKGSKIALIVIGLMSFGFALLVAVIGVPIWCTAIFGLGGLMWFWLALSGDSKPSEKEIAEIVDYQVPKIV